MSKVGNLKLVDEQWLATAIAQRQLQPRETIASRIRQERARSDRNGRGFSMVVFGSLVETDHSTVALSGVATVLLSRLRDTDEAGWLAEQTLCAILPETKPDGAEALLADIREKMPHAAEDLECRIYCYPSDWFDGGSNGDGTTPPRMRSKSDRHDSNGNGNGNGHGSNGNGNGNGHHNGNGNGNGKHLSPERNVRQVLDGVEAVKAQITVEPMEALLVQPMPKWKRELDIVVAAMALLAFCPVMAIVAMLVKLSPPGPVFFRQKRTGPGNRVFTMYKFRTMIDGAEKLQANLQKFNERDGPAFKMKRDPRTTRIGRFLRKTSLDELPQLLNVLKGDMSLVGPRPLPVHESDRCLPWHRRRLDVTPGITCTWQIQLRSSVTFTEWMRMDIAYAKGQTFLRDLKILLKTVPAVVGCRSTS